MRRGLKVVALVTLMLGLLVAGATAASAGLAYPPGGPVIDVTTVSGNTVNVNGSGWQPGAPITVKVESIVLGTLTADAQGMFSQNFTIPCSIGNGDHTVTATGIGQDGQPRTASSLITLSGCPGGTAAAATPGRLAFTGSNSLPWAEIGGVALLLGVVLMVIGMRRRGNRPGLQA
jgi:hypothetical protein